MMEETLKEFLNLSRRPDLYEDSEALLRLPELIQSLGSECLANHDFGAELLTSSSEKGQVLGSTVEDCEFLNGLRVVYRDCARKILFITGKEDKNPVLACSEFHVVSIIRSILRISRILCGTVPGSQILVQGAGFHKTLGRSFSSLEKLYQGSDGWCEQVKLLVRDSLKFFVNLIQGNSSTCSNVLLALGSNGLQQMAWFAVVNDPESVDLVTYFFFVLVKASGSDTTEVFNKLMGKDDTVGSSPMLVILGGFVNDTASGVRREGAFDNLLWILEQVLCRSNSQQLMLLWECASGSTMSMVGCGVTPEQLVVLKMLEELLGIGEREVVTQNLADEDAEERCLEERATALRRVSLAKVLTQEQCAQVTTVVCSWFSQVLSLLQGATGMLENSDNVTKLEQAVKSDDVTKLEQAVKSDNVSEFDRVADININDEVSNVTSKDQSVESSDQRMNKDDNKDSDMTTTDGVGVQGIQRDDDATANLQSDDASFVLNRVTEEAAVTVSSLFGHVLGLTPNMWDSHRSEGTRAIRLALGRLNYLNSDTSKGGAGERSKLVRVIGNFCYGNPWVQTLIRDVGGIPVVLNCCNIDERSPWLREWGLFAVRNLCHNNLENQTIIDSMRVQGTVQHPIIAKAGLKVELTEDGKPRMVKLPKQE